MDKKANRSIPSAVAALGRRGGVPAYPEIEALRRMPGEDGEINRAVWGASPEDLDREFEAEMLAEIARRPHVFLNKFRPGRRKRGA